MRFGPYTNQETAAHGFTHWFEFTSDDLTTVATNTAQVFTMPFLFAVGDQCVKVAIDLGPAFSDASDSAFNDVTFSIGDTVGAADSIATAIQVNVNGTEILHSRTACASTPLTGFTAATYLECTFNSMSAKSLVNIDGGVLIASLQILSPQRTAAVIDSVLIGK